MEYDDQHGMIAFPSAKCVLDADATALRVDVQLEDGGDQGRMEQVMEEHLQRFGFRETLVFDWRRVEAN